MLVFLRMSQRTASSPRSPDLPSELEPGKVSVLAHEGTYRDIELSDLALAEARANGVTFDTTRLVNVDVSAAQLDDLRLTHCALKGCNLANTQMQRASASRVRIETSRLTGINLRDATLRDVAFRDCRTDLASFGFSSLARVTFENCMLAQTDFLDAQLESVRFHHCDLTHADFRGARMQHCEFRRSDLTGLEGIENLRGAAMEWSDIIEMTGAFAAALGIEVLATD
jgi:uncharacterized protein YjbI with pentapeptide repeats